MPASEIIDQKTFDNFLDTLGGDVDFLWELIETYLASNPELFETMRQAIASGQAPALQRAAHTLKSGSANLGALAFAAQCKELEDMGRIGALDGADEKYRHLESAYTGVVAALQAWMKNARSGTA